MAQNQSGNFALDNLTYDLITILHEKSKGLEAYDRYLQDAAQDNEVRSVLEQIRQDDQRHIQQLQQHLQRCLSRSSGQQNRAA
jgi:hypothetical protein